MGSKTYFAGIKPLVLIRNNFPKTNFLLFSARTGQPTDTGGNLMNCIYQGPESYTANNFIILKLYQQHKLHYTTQRLTTGKIINNNQNNIHNTKTIEKYYK